MEWIETKSNQRASLDTRKKNVSVPTFCLVCYGTRKRQIKINKHYNDNFSLLNANNWHSIFYHHPTFDPSKFLEAMQKKYIKMETAISLTGLSRASIYTEIYKAKILGEGIPFYKFGPRQLRFCEDELLEWMESRDQTYRPVKEAVESNKRKAARPEAH